MNALAGYGWPQMGLSRQTQLSPEDESFFRYWWREAAPYIRQGADPNPVGHYYDCRGAWRAGDAPPYSVLLGGPVFGDWDRPRWSSGYKSPLSPQRCLLGASGRVYDSFEEDPEDYDEDYEYLMEVE